jgi:hypothetical protein
MIDPLIDTSGATTEDPLSLSLVFDDESCKYSNSEEE